MMNIAVVYQDDDLAVINKPAGVTVNTAQSVRGETIQGWWESQLQHVPAQTIEQWQSLVPADFSEQYGTPEEIFQQRGGIVHRLDKETSGALILAKNPGSLVNLLAQFRLRQVQKSYLALVHGRLKVQAGELDLPIRRNPRDRQKLHIHPEGRAARTRYQVKAEYRSPDGDIVSLIACEPQTGRMHQIRVHFAHLGHPLVSDRLYAGRKRVKQDLTWCPRHFLHAEQLVFTQPRTAKQRTVEAPLSPDLQQVLKSLSRD